MSNNSTNTGRVIRLDPQDNVVVAPNEIPVGTFIASEHVTTLHKVPAGHKIATRLIRKGEPVLKYNTVIGFAGEDTPPGSWMHSHNILFDDFERDYAFSKNYQPVDLLPPEQRATFQGFVREDGRVGTRNYVGIFVVGNCGATVARKISDHFTQERLAEYTNINGVVPFIHELGCGMEMTGEPMDLLRRTISGYIRNPNTAAALVIALGCERNNIHGFFEQMGLEESDKLKKLVIQDTGGTRKTIEKGIEAVEAMLPLANRYQRETVSAEHICIGMQCGGSDGFSGLSANPALGAAVDILVRHGGTAILSETTEIFGVEHTLTARAMTPAVGQKLVDCIHWWLKYNEGRDCQINGRVSPGNNAGGLANVLEKSLGGAKKGGNAPLMEVYKYAEPVKEHGLVFMDTPGYDPVSATGQIAGGANLVTFTTGRGSCFGSFPAPCIKLASNTPMYTRMEEDMDINCGVVIDGEKTIQQMGQVIFEKILRVASGEESKSEALGVGENEFAPWPIGVLA
ncbi:altronate dehydratase [Atlantibacter subterranea]|uniref:UxaA family hydrolase n=1 Tax=Atlantibacter subterraneus TaxID=255519 RepID=UPI0011833DAC|nr:altronate dehydratase family protein [Atlantibacter subterranea]TSJ59402.1 altronate dehydratase [Atlantibacter subterranea]